MFYPVLLTMPLFVIGGWYLGQYIPWMRPRGNRSKLPRDYLLGLNYLINEQPDKAVDLFLKLLAVDNETFETHLALGSLFRRRGEVERAIRIHQNLIARPQLNLNERKQALLALGQDYMSAGLFDRAERVFLEVIELNGQPEIQSLTGLVAIYQQ